MDLTQSVFPSPCEGPQTSALADRLRSDAYNHRLLPLTLPTIILHTFLQDGCQHRQHECGIDKQPASEMVSWIMRKVRALD